MDVATTISKGVRSVASDYDAACKRLLSERQILSRIMNEWIDEFSDVTPQQIERECFRDMPRVGTDYVGRDEIAAGRLDVLAQEDKPLSEGATTFDVRFEALFLIRMSTQRTLSVLR